MQAQLGINGWLVSLQESDCESSVGSPEPASGVEGNTDLNLMGKGIHTRVVDDSMNEAKMTPNLSSAAHLNGSKIIS